MRGFRKGDKVTISSTETIYNLVEIRQQGRNVCENDTCYGVMTEGAIIETDEGFRFEVPLYLIELQEQKYTFIEAYQAVEQDHSMEFKAFDKKGDCDVMRWTNTECNSGVSISWGSVGYRS